MAKSVIPDRKRCLPFRRVYSVVAMVCALAMVVCSAGGVSAEVSFERLELALDHPIDAWICRDIDGDGDADLVLLRTSANVSRPNHEAVIVRQQPTGRFAYRERQVVPMHSTSGLYDVGDVAGDGAPELIQVTSSGVHYFVRSGNGFDSTAQTLITPDAAPDIPAVANPQAWDFAWPLVTGEKECVALPYLDHLDLWRRALSPGAVFTPSGTIHCDALSRSSVNSWGAGYRMLYPKLRAQSTPRALELFFESGASWHGVRRSALDKTDFATSLDFGVAPAEVGQVLGLRPEFRTGCLMIDLNNDGAPDAVQWSNQGGINNSSCHVKVYFGPFNETLPTEPHSEVAVEGVYGFPVFGDLNGDGRVDMLICAMETGSLSTAKIFVMKRLALHLLAYRQRADNSFSTVPDCRQKDDYRLDLDVPEPVTGPLVTFAGDLDGDGYDDFVVQTGQDHLDIFRGNAKDMIDDDSPERLECRQAAEIESVDIDGDGRRDLLLLHRESSAGESITVLLAR